MSCCHIHAPGPAQAHYDDLKADHDDTCNRLQSCQAELEAARTEARAASEQARTPGRGSSAPASGSRRAGRGLHATHAYGQPTAAAAIHILRCAQLGVRRPLPACFLCRSASCHGRQPRCRGSPRRWTTLSRTSRYVGLASGGGAHSGLPMEGRAALLLACSHAAQCRHRQVEGWSAASRSRRAPPGH